MSDELERRNTPAAGPGAGSAGIALILVGGYFLLRNVFGWQLNNWWALFILVPAVFMLGSAIRFYNEDGRLSGRVSQAITGGLMMVLVALVFLLNLDWSNIWPVFLIFGGVAVILSTRRS